MPTLTANIIHIHCFHNGPLTCSHVWFIISINSLWLSEAKRQHRTQSSLLYSLHCHVISSCGINYLGKKAHSLPQWMISTTFAITVSWNDEIICKNGDNDFMFSQNNSAFCGLSKDLGQYNYTHGNKCFAGEMVNNKKHVKCTPNTAGPSNQWPLLLTWFNFNPSMDK